MAQEIEKQRVSITREGRLTILSKQLFDSRLDALTKYPRTMEGLAFAGANGEPRTRHDGKWIMDLRYEGLIEEPTEKDDSYDLRGEEREVPIENFPDRSILEKEFGAYEYDGALLFPYRLPRDSSTTALAAYEGYKADENKDINPLFNCRSYPVEYQVAIWSLTRKRVPQIIVGMVGTVQTKLPSGFSGMGAKSDASWYVRPLQTRKRGNSVEIQVQFKEISKFSALEALEKLLKSRQKGRGQGGGLLITGVQGSPGL